MDKVEQKKQEEAAANSSKLIEKKRLQLASTAAGKAAAKAAGGGAGAKRKQGAAAAALNDNSNLAHDGSQLEQGQVSSATPCVKPAAPALCCHCHTLTAGSNALRQVLVGRRLVRLVRGLTKGKIVRYDHPSDMYNILFKDNERLDLTLDQIVHGGIVQLSQKKRPNFTRPDGDPQMSQRF